MSLYRKRGRETPLESLVEAPQVAPGLSALEAGLAVEAALARLSPEQREAVLLKVCHGFKFDEIAEILSTPASTIKSRVYTALDQLRGLLSPVAGGGAAG
jgi:RNA polymerase sigma-70 factor (ECF subfamily)